MEAGIDFYSGVDFAIYQDIPGHFGESRNDPTFYGIQYNHSGGLWLRVNNGKLYEVEGPYVFITHPGAHFDYGNFPGQTRHHCYLCVQGERVERYRETGLLTYYDENPLRKVRRPAHFLKSMLSIMSLLQASFPAIPPRAILQYEELLLQIRELSSGIEAEEGGAQHSLHALADAIKRTPQQEWDFTAEAERRGITPTHFRRLFKQQTSVPPQQFLILCRLKLASVLLVNTEHPVGEIARRVGIVNEFYFSRIFKTKYTVSPLHYRHEFARRSPERMILLSQNDSPP